MVVQGLVELEERPNLIKLTKYIEGGIEPCWKRRCAALRAACSAPAGATSEMKKLLHAAPRQHEAPVGGGQCGPAGPGRLLRAPRPATRRNKVLDAQVRTFRHNREHYQKITANLLPVLSMLTSGDLGRSPSPDLRRWTMRPIMNFEKIERAGHVLYMCLDSLPDPSVATAIGHWPGRPLPARAGMRYNLGGYRRISLFVDEGVERHQPAADRDPEQGRRGWHLHHLRHADAGRPGQAAGQRRRGRAWRWAT